MRRAHRFYFLIVLTPLAVLVAGNVLLNFWVDPLNTIRDHKLTTRTYALPALLAELELPAASAANFDTYMIGTSRSRWGHDIRQFPTVLNLGVDKATDRMIDNLLVGQLQTSSRARVYLVDTMGLLQGVDRALNGRLVTQLLSAGVTKVSLRQLIGQMQSRFTPGPGESRDPNAPPEPVGVDLDFNQRMVSYMRYALPVRPHSQAVIEQRIQRIKELPVSHDAFVLFYDGPFSPTYRSDPFILEALHQRANLWRQVLATSNATRPSPNGEERPRVTVAYVSYATPADWSEPAETEMWAEANWWDPLHFKPIVGRALLNQLLIDAAKIQQTTTTP